MHLDITQCDSLQKPALTTNSDYEVNFLTYPLYEESLKQNTAGLTPGSAMCPISNSSAVNLKVIKSTNK